MATRETRSDVESTMLVTALTRFGQAGLATGALLMFGSPGFVAAGVGKTAYVGLGLAALGAGSYLLGRLVVRSAAPGGEPDAAVPGPDE
ncbi:MAG: hypothetical protein ABEH40_01845 [Haloferacaceae archaeon]